MMRRRDLWPAAAALTGCRRSTRKRIAVIPKGTAHLFWISVRKGAEAAGREFGVEILWNGPASETEYARQIQILESMAAQRVDAIAIAAAERKALVGPVERVFAAGIPVAVFDSGLDTTSYTAFIATGNYAAGRTAARTLAELIGGRGEVAVVMHAAGAQSSMDRERGFDEAMAQEFPQIRIVGRQFGRSDRAAAMSAAENLLTAHPALAGLFASAEPSSVGAAQALKSRGLSGKVKLVSFDASESMIEDLKGGTISAMLVQDPVRMGYETVKALVEKLNGGTPARRLDLEARVVRAADLARPEIQRLLNPAA
jgi:ribose transport system substrate-binding protein